MSKIRSAVAGLLVVLVAGGLLVALLSALPGPVSQSVETPWVGSYLWDDRGLDLVAQALLVLAGVLGVLLVLGPQEEAM